MAAVLTLPLLELALLITAGRVIGVLPTLALLAAAALAGGLVLRRVGSARVGAVPGSPARSAPPAGTALLVPAGLLLIVPGFLSDLVGFALLVPAVRRVLAARLGEAVLRRVAAAGRIQVVPGQVVTGTAGEVRVTDVRVTDVGHPRALPPTD